MIALGHLARVELVLLISLIFGAVAFLIVTGRVQLAGLLDDKSTGDFDPARLQLLVLTLTSALLMLTRLDQMRATHTLSMPSDALLYVLGGSQGFYLVRKYFESRSTRKGE